MTSVTGDSRLLPSRRIAIDRVTWRRGREGGFTLVEIIVVMAILVMLFGLVAVSLSLYMGKASRSATVARILKLEQYLDEYKGKVGHYPPDGIDSVVKTEDGQIIQGSACLYYYLSRPIQVPEKVGGRTKLRTYPAIAEFQDKELTAPDEEFPGVREIKDGWDNPMHYDNTEDGQFRPQRGEVHVPPLMDEEHPQDPRDGSVELDGKAVVPQPGIQGRDPQRRKGDPGRK